MAARAGSGWRPRFGRQRSTWPAWLKPDPPDSCRNGSGKELFPVMASVDWAAAWCSWSRNGSVRQARFGSLGGTGRYRQFEITCRGQQLTVVVVDIKSTPWVSRRVPLEHLRTLVEELGDRPVLVTGDFNTPSDSIWFDSWRDKLSNAWTTTGQGLRPTWPVPLPVLISTRPGQPPPAVRPLPGTWSTHSDHRPLVSHFTITPS